MVSEGLHAGEDVCLSAPGVDGIDQEVGGGEIGAAACRTSPQNLGVLHHNDGTTGVANHGHDFLNEVLAGESSDGGQVEGLALVVMFDDGFPDGTAVIARKEFRVHDGKNVAKHLRRTDDVG